MSEIRDVDGALLFRDETAPNPADLARKLAEEGRSLARADLSGLDLSGAQFNELDLSGARLTGAKLRGAYFRDCDVSGADLSGVEGRGLKAVGSSFAGTRLVKADCPESAFARCSFSRVVAGGLDSQGESLGCRFPDASFTECSFTRSQFGGAVFERSVLDACDANGWSAGRASFEGAIVNMSDLRSGHMRGTSFVNAEVSNSQLDNCDLRETSFKGARVAATSLTDSVMARAQIRQGRYRKVDMTGVRASKAHVAENVYEACDGLPAEMRADRAGDRVARAMAKGLSYASLGGAFAGGFMLAPDSLTQGMTDNQLVGRGAAGIATMAAANMAMRRLAPVVEKQVIQRIERVLSKAAPGVSRAAASIPFAELSHAWRKLEFARVTGMNEKRVSKLVERANQADPEKDPEFRATGIIASDDKTQIIVARDKDAMSRMQDLLARGKDRVVVIRLDDEGKPREAGPGLYEFRRDGSMTAVWFHKGAPDFATQFDAEGHPLRHRSFSARDTMIRSEREPIHTKVLSRRETSMDEAISWLRSGRAGEQARTAVGQGQGLAVAMREAGHFLRASGEYLKSSHPEVAEAALEQSRSLEAVNPGRSDRIAPDVWPRTAKGAAKAMDGAVEALGEVELKGLARIGGRLNESLRGYINEFSQARKASKAEAEGGSETAGAAATRDKSKTATARRRRGAGRARRKAVATAAGNEPEGR